MKIINPRRRSLFKVETALTEREKRKKKRKKKKENKIK